MKEFKSFFKEVGGNEGSKCNHKNDYCSLEV